MTDIYNRIRELREANDWSRSSLAEKIDEKEGKIVAIEHGRQRVNVDLLAKFAKIFSVSFDYLVTGQDSPQVGAAWRESNSLEEAYRESMKPGGVIQTSNGEELIEIPQLDVSFSAGYGSYPDDHILAVGSRPFSGKWIRNKGLKPENLALTRVHGDSMEPLLKDKDMVMLDQSVNTPITTMPVAFRLDGELYIKLCQNDGKGNLAMISVNKVYDPIIIDKESPPPDFAIIAAVVWHAHSWI